MRKHLGRGLLSGLLGLSIAAGGGAMTGVAVAADQNGEAASGAVHDRPAPQQQAVTNSDLDAAIRDRIRDDRLLKTSNVAVTTNGGEVTLTGEVASNGARTELLEIVRSTPGVVKVRDLTRFSVLAPEAHVHP